MEMSEKEFNIWVGNRLRELREKAGLKKVEVAQKTGLPDSFISNIENKGKKVSSYSLNKLLTAMGYTLEDLADDEKKKSLRLSFAVS
jgi:transcriptional regulator with XRE-family HTH domain